MDNNKSRIVVLIDMDCFFCQVEVRLNPSLAGKPVAVIQYTDNKRGGLVAVSYEARARGVKRFMRGEEAMKVCPELMLCTVPCVRGKADTTRYRDAGAEVADVFCSFSDCVQRASVDEAFIDLTKLVDKRISQNLDCLDINNFPSTFVVGYSDISSNNSEERKKGVAKWLDFIQGLDKNSNDFRLAIGALIVEEIRAEVFKKTGFTCSAGIAHNKILAKLVAGLHKPKSQTILPLDSIPELYESTNLQKVRNLGGKFGEYVSQKLSITKMSELYQFSKSELQDKFDDRGIWLYDIARGIDNEPVTPRLIADSIGCSKNFRGMSALNTVESVKYWLGKMAEEVSERLGKDMAENKRRAKNLCVSFAQEVSMTRSCPLSSYHAKTIAEDAYDLLKKFNKADLSNTTDSWHPPIVHLGLSASKFNNKQSTTIDKFLSSSKSETIIEPQPETSQPISPSKAKTNSQPKSFFLKLIAERKSQKEIEKLNSKVNDEEINANVNEETKEESSDDLMQTCSECSKKILLTDFFEHLDYHAALKLSASLNGKIEVKKAPPSMRTESQPAKKKRKVQKNVTTPQITSYFNKVPPE